MHTSILKLFSIHKDLLHVWSNPVTIFRDVQYFTFVKIFGLWIRKGYFLSFFLSFSISFFSLYFFLSFSIYFFLFFFLSFSLYFFLYFFLSLFIYLFLSLFLSLSFFISFPFFLSLYLSLYLFISGCLSFMLDLSLAWYIHPLNITTFLVIACSWYLQFLHPCLITKANTFLRNLSTA